MLSHISRSRCYGPYIVLSLTIVAHSAMKLAVCFLSLFFMSLSSDILTPSRLGA
jgi:hypothetical protein